MSYNSINSMSPSPLRITGMASGLDTDTIISDLMKIEKLKVDKVFRQKVKVEWKKQSLTDVRNKLRTFRETYASALSKDKNMFTSSVYMKYKVEMQSNTYVNISTNASAREGVNVVNEITQLAETAKVYSENIIDEIPGQYAQLKDIAFKNSLFAEGEDTIAFSINGKEFTFNKEDTLKKMMDDINKSDAGVNIYFSNLSKGLHIESKTTGSNQKIVIDNITGNAFGDNSAFGITEKVEGEVTGKNALLKINNFNVEQNTNRFTIDGIVYELKATFTASNQVTFNVTRDTQYTVDRIKEFVDKYNELTESLNGIINEKKYYDYDPLTDEQREDLKEEEVKKWDEKAKSGLLKNDTAISSLISTLRASIYKKVEGVGLSLSEIGITTGSYLDKGKLVVDEQKLTKFINERPEDVMNMFMATTPSSEEIAKSEKYAKDGFFARMTTTFNDYYNTLDFDKMDENIRDYEGRMKNLENKLYDTQERYYRQFAQLESALAKMQSQTSWIAQQFSTQ